MSVFDSVLKSDKGFEWILNNLNYRRVMDLIKCKCIRAARVNGLTFVPDEVYYLEEQVFTEEYKPAIHPRPARGYRIRYIRYKVALPTEEPLLKDDNDLYRMVNVRIAYFYDRSYCEYHDWKDERGRDAECFEYHFVILERPNPKSKLYTTPLSRCLNNIPMKFVKVDITDNMRRNWREQMYAKFGGRSPEDWDFDTFMQRIGEYMVKTKQNN